MKKTPLYDRHESNGGRIVDFAGFLMPVSFTGIVEEHRLVRRKVGLFDVSHMGEIEITGEKAVDFADYVVTNRVGSLEDGQICYTVCCNESGGVLDDLLVYRFGRERILIVANAANYEKIYRHLSGVDFNGARVKNLSDRISQIAVQGPLSRKLMLGSELCSKVRDKVEALDYYRFIYFRDGEDEVIISRTGYTGELGYEVYVPNRLAVQVWDDLIRSGSRLGVGPVGLGARDTLRFEAGYCLYGHEIDEQTSPLEARLSWVVKLKKGDFIGRQALLKEKEEKPGRKLIGLEMLERGIPRQGFKVFQDGDEVGKVTSGTYAPTLEKPLAMALISRKVPKSAQDYEIEVRKRRLKAKRVKLPFYEGRVKD